jgi:hypothetical protein
VLTTVYVCRRTPAFGATLLAGLAIACAAAAPASAAELESEDREGSPAAAALAERSDSPRTRTDGTGGATAGQRAPRGGDTPDAADPASAEDDEPNSRARAALRSDDDPRSLEAELDESAAAIRREVRAKAATLGRRAREDAPGKRSARAGTSSRDVSDAADGATIAVAASDDRVQLLRGNHNILVRRRALVRGYLPNRRAGSGVVLELLSGGRWVTVDTATTIEDGRFYLAWYPNRPGYFRVRVRPSSTRSTIEPSGVRLLYVFRSVLASWYGPGFYGNRTACGQTFTSRLIGVAHRSLPCGHRLTVRYRGVSRTVTVVDRGPYVHGRTYDLTEALRNYLGFDGVDEILATS